ncbi:MAG TPA: flagellar biosynthesis anti-sigma factor FlgM [Acidimicrobiia bacterium]
MDSSYESSSADDSVTDMEPANVVRIDQIRTAIARGDYRVPALAIADAILAFHLVRPSVPPRPA